MSPMRCANASCDAAIEAAYMYLPIVMVGCIVEKLCVQPFGNVRSELRRLASQCKRRETIMAARCAVCGKGPQVGYTVSHSHIRNKRTFRPNLQPVHTTVDGENVRVRVRQVPQGRQGPARGRVSARYIALNPVRVSTRRGFALPGGMWRRCGSGGTAG